MADAVPPMTVTLEWDHAQEFTGQAGKHEVPIDGSQAAGPSPMQYLALAITGCMGIDIVHILTRGRYRLQALSAKFTGERAQVEPKRFTRIGLHFTVATDAPEAQVERTIQLSREKYCSAMTSLRDDIVIDIGYTIEPV
jgi:putative redox protein